MIIIIYDTAEEKFGCELKTGKINKVYWLKSKYYSSIPGRGKFFSLLLRPYRFRNLHPASCSILVKRVHLEFDHSTSSSVNITKLMKFYLKFAIYLRGMILMQMNVAFITCMQNGTHFRSVYNSRVYISFPETRILNLISEC